MGGMPPQNPTFVSFYTPDYEWPAKHLERELRERGFNYRMVAVKSLGTWRKNACHKARFVLEQLEATPEGQAIVWVDADSLILEYPKLLFELTEDFAFKPWISKGGVEPHTCVLFARSNAQTKGLVEHWIDLAESTPDAMLRHGDQGSLQDAIASGKHADVKIRHLPMEYGRNTIKFEDGEKPTVIKFIRWGHNYDLHKERLGLK